MNLTPTERLVSLHYICIQGNPQCTGRSPIACYVICLSFADLKQVMRSIRDNITEEVLLNEIYEIIRLPMYADRIRNDSKAHQHTASARRR